MTFQSCPDRKSDDGGPNRRITHTGTDANGNTYDLQLSTETFGITLEDDPAIITEEPTFRATLTHQKGGVIVLNVTQEELDYIKKRRVALENTVDTAVEGNTANQARYRIMLGRETFSVTVTANSKPTAKKPRTRTSNK